MLILTVFVLAPGLFGPSGTVAASPLTDAAQYFVYVRKFGFDELRHGHIALWNPYIFSGCPFLGGWQEALLYPPNWIYLVLPLSVAMNCEIAIHIFVVGLGTALWVQRSGAHRLAALLAGAMIMFGAPVFLHEYAGHLSMVDALAMAPWVLLAIDGTIERPELRWALLGAGAFGLQLLAGHPQTVFNTLVAGAVYGLLKLAQCRYRVRAVLAFIAIGVGAVVLSAPQLVAGFAAATEGARRGGLPYSYAAMLSFPPENFVTLLAPRFFGDVTNTPYWGRGYLWEVSAFVGVVGLIMAIYGAVRSTTREKWIWIAMVALMLWFALAANTPLFHVLYSYVPGFNRFRGHAKFVYPAALFIAMLAGQGMTLALREPNRLRAPGAACVAFGAVALVVGLMMSSAIGSSPSGWWTHFTGFVFSTGESSFSGATYAGKSFGAGSESYAGQQCLVAAVLLIAAGVGMVAAVKRPRVVYLIAVLGVAELVYYAWSSVTTFDVGRTHMIAGEQRFIAAHPGDYRILQLAYPPDDVIGSTTADIWGYDPSVMGRYAEFMFFAEGRNPDDASIYLNFPSLAPLLRVVRCRYAFVNAAPGMLGFRESQNPLPHVFLAPSWTSAIGRDAVFSKMAAPGFDPAKTAVLEDADIAPPTPVSTVGAAAVTASTSDTLTIQADTSGPSLLVITDPYSRYWRATALAGSSQSSYAVLPCDYAIMAIPLQAGHHAFEIRYMPDGFQASLWLMALGWLAYAVLWVGVARRAAQH